MLKLPTYDHSSYYYHTVLQFFYTYFLQFLELCRVDGRIGLGDGTTKGDCHANELCQANGQCKGT
jgi:hypothetical protein